MRNKTKYLSSFSLIFFIILSTSVVSYSQYACGSVSKDLRGYNEWEIFQSETCRMIIINPLGKNEFIKDMKIKTVTQYHSYSGNKEKTKKYQHDYDSLGNLVLTKSMFHYFLNDSGNYSIEERYRYNVSTGFLSSIKYKHLAHVDQSPQHVNCTGCYFSERIMNYWPEDHLLESIEFYCDYDNEAKCIIKYKYCNNDLIKKIVYKHLGTVEYEISFEYKYYK